MREYVLKISARDPEHPLAEKAILEFGFKNQQALKKSVGMLGEMFRMFETPEAVAEFILKNGVLFQNTNTLVKGV